MVLLTLYLFLVVTFLRTIQPCSWPVERNISYFKNLIPCPPPKTNKHGWVSSLPHAMKVMFPDVRMITSKNGTMYEVHSNGSCSTIDKSERGLLRPYGIIFERNSRSNKDFNPLSKMNNKSLRYITIRTTPDKNHSCVNCLSKDLNSKIFAPNSIIKPPTLERIHTLESLYKEKKDALKNGALNRHGDDVKYKIIYPHTLRNGKGHLEFLRHVATKPHIFENYSFVFSTGRKSGSLRIMEKIIDTFGSRNITFEFFNSSDETYDTLLCDPLTKLVVTWSEKDANPRIPYEALFCNVPHFSSIEANLNPSLASVGYFQSYFAKNITLDLKRALNRDWGNSPVRFARSHINYRNMICGMFAHFETLHKCCLGSKIT